MSEENLNFDAIVCYDDYFIELSASLAEKLNLKHLPLKLV
jgi:hypothetical protein